MFKESCALPRSITRVRCRYEFSPGITPEFILETPRFSLETPRIFLETPNFSFDTPHFYWELQTVHLIHKIFLLILELFFGD